jgi:hypothetical protein
VPISGKASIFTAENAEIAKEKYFFAFLASFLVQRIKAGFNGVCHL